MKKNTKITTTLVSILIFLTGLNTLGQVVGEYRSAGSGAWDSSLSWELFEDEGWVPAQDFPDGPDKIVTICSGHDIIYRESNAEVRDISIESGGRLFSDGAGSYWYLVVYGNITCNGTIGNEDTTDGICLKPEGDSCLISGSGDCRFRRIRKDSDSVSFTKLIIGMDLEVYYDGTGDAIYNNMPGTSLGIEIRPLCGLTLHASLDLQDAWLHIVSDFTGNGSLICPDVQHDGPANTFLDLYIENDNHWHFIGTPVSGQSIQPEFVPDPLNNAFDFYKWNEGVAEDSGWVNIRNASGGLNTDFETEFAMGRGYLVSYSNAFGGNQVRTFSGPVNTGDVSIPVSHDNNSWNLISNPYPSGLNWQSNGVDKSHIAGLAMYIWEQELNQGLGGYLVSGLFVIPSSSMLPIVPPMNGFFVKSVSDGAVSISPDTANTLVHAGMPLYKRTKAEEELCLRLNIISGSYRDEMVIAIRPGATQGYDPALDAEKLFVCHDSVPEIAGRSSGGKLLCIDIIDGTPAKVPLYVHAPASNALTIQASGQSTFPVETGIFLVDSLEGSIVDLRETDTYTFLTSGSVMDNRFHILMEESTGISSKGLAESNIIIDHHNGRVVIYNPSGDRGMIYFSDLAGRILHEYRLDGSIYQQFPTPYCSSLLIVSVRYSLGVTSSKIVRINHN